MFPQAIEEHVQYDGSGSAMAGCHIEVSDTGVICEVTILVEKDMKGPIHVFYEIEGFYQNHRSYLKSLSWEQLHPEQSRKDPKESTLQVDCYPLWKNKTRILHPCGVVPNTLFNDVIALKNVNLNFEEDEIAWRSDIKELYKMPEGFSWQFLPSNGSLTDPCLSKSAHTAFVPCNASLCAAAGWKTETCFGYVCSGGYFDNFACDSGDLILFKYGSHDKFQYLYETFPQVISPLVGVNSEHFAVWMKTAALPKFRKLYGRINTNLKEGTELVFIIENNFDVHALSGRKTLVVATSNGFEYEFLVLSYIVVGCVSLATAIAFASLQLLKPRQMGEVQHTSWLSNGA
tara:strand:- start:814 stop:1848 length:1035 start_codon:yes stop_codon:yes gene_type:complete